MNKEISIKEIRKKLKEIFPQFSETYQIVDIKNCYSEVKLLSNKNNLRPGNTISGPSMFKLADISFYVAVMGSVKLVEKSVPINVSINFLNKPLLSNLIGISKAIFTEKCLEPFRNSLVPSSGSTRKNSSP